MLNWKRVERIYLDELESNLLGVEIVKLVVEPKETIVDVAKSLVEKANITLLKNILINNSIWFVVKLT